MEDRRRFMKLALLAGGILPTLAHAAKQPALQVAYAGSMGAAMNGGIRQAVARTLGAELRGRGQGAMGLAHLIVGNSIRPDVFISVTPGPMEVVLKAGYAEEAIPVARTEMVLAYSPRGPRAAAFAEARAGHKQWWQLLQVRGLRFGRTDPNTDPQGLNILFMMKLAALFYHDPGLVERALGPVLNPAQIFPEAEIMARLQDGQMDASSAYKTQPAALGLPFIRLPNAINLGDAALEPSYRKVSVSLHGKRHYPAPLVFYAATLKHAEQPKLAQQFVHWLSGPEAQQILQRYHYDRPAGAVALR